MSFEFDYLVISDGGSRGHGTANQGYGSYVRSNVSQEKNADLA